MIYRLQLHLQIIIIIIVIIIVIIIIIINIAFWRKNYYLSTDSVYVKSLWFYLKVSYRRHISIYELSKEQVYILHDKWQHPFPSIKFTILW
jgi:hypothetical protein